jgi:hypothetical protein
MSITRPDPATRLLDLPPPSDRTVATGVQEREIATEKTATP